MYCEKTRRTFENTREMLKAKACISGTVREVCVKCLDHWQVFARGRNKKDSDFLRNRMNRVANFQIFCIKKGQGLRSPAA
jgi:hypothetical protein